MAVPSSADRGKIADSVKGIKPRDPNLIAPSLKPRISEALGIDLSWTPGEGPSPFQQIGRTGITPSTVRMDWARERAYKNSLPGWKRAVGSFTEGPVMKALMGITKPLSMTVGAVKETLDWAGGGEWNKADWHKAVGETYFFGDLLRDFDILQGDAWWEKWGARTLGFAGDVALDPLTYLGLVGKGIGIASQVLRGGGRAIAGQAIRKSVIRGLGDDGIRTVQNMGLADGLADDILGAAVDDIVEGTSNVVTRMADGSITFGVGKQSKRTGFIAAADGAPMAIDDVARVTLEPSVVGDIKKIMNAEMRAGKRGASSISTEELRIIGKHMYESGMDKAGRAGADVFRAADKKWSGGVLKSMKEADKLDLQFGLKIPGTGPLGRMLFRHQLQRPVGIRMLNSRMPGVGTFVRGVPQSARFVFMGLKHGESGLFGWMKRGGRLPELRKLMRTEWLDQPAKRHAGRAMLHAAGRGDAMARTVKQEMIRHANQFFKDVADSGANTKDVYHALAGDEAAAARIGQELTGKGIKFMATLREVANTRAGHEFLGESSNYVPRVLSDEARDYLDNKGIGLVTRKHRRPYDASGFEKQRKYVPKSEFDAAVEAEYKQLLKKNAKATMAQAQKKVQGRGLEPDFLGEELVTPGTILNDGTVAKDVEQQIADIMERTGISYALFDDDLLASIPAYIEAVSSRTGEVFTETLLKNKGVFRERMVELTRFPNANVTAATAAARKTQRLLMDATGQLQVLFKKRAEAEAPSSLLDQQIAAQEEVLAAAERAFEVQKNKLDDIADAATDEEIRLVAAKTEVDRIVGEINALQLQQIGITEQELVQRAAENQVLLNAAADLLDEGGVLKSEWQTASAATAALVHLEDRILSAFGSSETFDAFEALSKHLTATNSEWATQQTGVDWLETLVGVELLPDEGHGFIRATVVEPPSEGGLAAVGEGQPAMFLVETTDGEVGFHAWDVGEKLSDARKIVDDLDESGAGAWLGLEMTLADDVLLDDSVAQLAWSRRHLAEIAGDAADSIERYIEVTGLPTSVGGIGAVPTPEAVIAAREVITNTIADVTSEGGINATFHADNGSFREWMMASDPEFQEAVWTYFSTMPGMTTPRYTTMGALNDDVAQMTQQILEIVRNNEAFIRQADSIRFTVTNEQGEVVRHLGLADYVNALRYEVGVETAKHTGTPMAIHTHDVEDIMSADYYLIASGGGNAGNAPGLPDGSQQGGLNWVTDLYKQSTDRPSAPSGGSNPGYLVKVPDNASDIVGSGKYYYVKSYRNDTGLPDSASVDVGGGMVLSAGESGKHRVQGEAIANALYRAFGVERGTTRMGVELIGTAPTTGAAPVRGSAFGTMAEGTWTVTSPYEKLLRPAVHGIPIADQVRVQFKSGLYDLAQVVDDGFRLRTGEVLTQADLASEPVLLSELAGDQFLVDVLVSNLDTFGLNGDNIAVKAADGMIYRIDNGGVFHWGAMGGMKRKYRINDIAYAWDEVIELLGGPGTHEGKGTFLGGLPPGMASNVANQPAKKVKVGQYMAPAWMQYRDVLDAAPGAGFTGEIEQQLKALMKIRARHGGWQGFVAEIVGPHATADDIQMFTRFLEVRTEKLANHLGLEFPEAGSTAMLVDAAEDFGIDQAATHAVMESIPFEPIMATAEAAGHRAWVNRAQDQLHGIYYKPEADASGVLSYPLGDAISSFDPRSQWAERMTLKEALKRTTKGKHLPQSPTHVLKALDGMGDALPLLVAEGKPLSAYALDDRLLFDDTAAEMLEDLVAEQQALADNVADDLVEQQVGVPELEDDWGFGYEGGDLTPDEQLEMLDALDDDVQRKLDEAFGKVDDEAGDEADIWLAEQEATDIQDLKAEVSLKINEALQAQEPTIAGPSLSVSGNLITSMDAVPWTAAHRASGNVGVVVMDEEGKIVMRMPITGGVSAEPLGSGATGSYWAHTVVHLDHYPQADLRRAAVLAAEDSLGMHVELVGFVPVVKGDDTPYFIARKAPGSTTITEDGPLALTQSPVAAAGILRLFTESKWTGVLDPMYYLGRQQASWMDTSMGGINASVPPLVYGSGNGVGGGVPKTFAMGIRLPQGAARNIRIFGVPAVYQDEWATAVARLADMGPWEQQQDTAMKKIAKRLEEMTPSNSEGGQSYANKDMSLDMLESIHDSNPELWAQFKAFLADDYDRENLWKTLGNAGPQKGLYGRWSVALFDAVDTASRRGIDIYDDLTWRQRLTFFGYLQREAKVIPNSLALEVQSGQHRLSDIIKGLKGVGRLTDEEFEGHVVNYIATISESNAMGAPTIGLGSITSGWYNRVKWEVAHIMEPLTGPTGLTTTFAGNVGRMSSSVQPQMGKTASLLKAGYSVPLTGPPAVGQDLTTHGGKFLITAGSGHELRHQRAIRLWANMVEGWRIKMAADGHTVAVWGNREGARFQPPLGSMEPTPTHYGAQQSKISTNFMVTNPRAVTVDQTPIIGAGAPMPEVPPWKIHELWGTTAGVPELRTSSVMSWQRMVDDYQQELGGLLASPAAKDAGDPEDLFQALNREKALAVESMEQVEQDVTGALLAVQEAEDALIPSKVGVEAEAAALDEFVALRSAAQDLSDTHRAANDALTRLGAGVDAAGNEIPLDALSDDLRNLRIAVGILGEGDAEMLRMAKEALDEGEDALTALGTFAPVGDDDTFYPLTRLQDREQILESVWASGFQPFGSYTQGPADMVEAMTAVTRFRAQGGWGRFLREYDKLHNLMKGYMIMKPGFHMRNFFSGVFMNYLHGVNLSSYRQFQRAYWRFQYDEALAAGLERRAARMKKVMVSRGVWGKATPEHMDILREMRDGGILGGTQGQVAGEFLATPQVAGKKINFGLVNPMNPRNAPLRISREVGVGTETFLRGVMGFDTLKKGGTVDEAFDTVVKFHFDYDDLSDFERRVVKRVVPFYTWTRKNMPLMLEQIGRNPAKMTAYLKAKHEIEMDLTPPGVVPDYFKRQGAIQMPWKYEGQDMFILPDLPFKTPIELLDPMLAFDSDLSVVERMRIAMGSLGTQITPLVKAPYEWKSKQNLWKGYTFDGRFQQVPTVFAKTPGLMRMLQPLGLTVKQNDIWIMRDYNLHTMAQLMPTFSDMRRLFPSEERYQQRTLSTWMSFVFGLGLRTNTVEEQQRTLRAQFYRELDEMQDMRSMLGAVERTP